MAHYHESECAYCRAEELYDLEFTTEQVEQNRHGKIRMYLDHGCECDDCKAAMTAYWKRQYQRRNTALCPDPIALDHAADQLQALLTTQTQLK
jgi:hypothetical protein